MCLEGWGALSWFATRNASSRPPFGAGGTEQRSRKSEQPLNCGGLPVVRGGRCSLMVLPMAGRWAYGSFLVSRNKSV